ncbi:hypothetical protein [uncultured Dialister sp.]|uniref:hypothetical protein n=1 Tax=uncultured Dialister sp. TaxID=278064 RepID=UPI00265E2E74|nr:hypothetical protein [uncultured Dialister sp.]
MNSISFNPHDELDAVTKDPFSAYALQLGMSASDFEKSFDKTPWERVPQSTEVFEFSRDTGNEISQSVLVALHDDKVDSFSVSFKGENVDDIDQLFKSAFDNLAYVLGERPTLEYSEFEHAQTRTWALEEGQVLQLKYGKVNDGKPGKSPLYVSIIRSFEYDE